MEANQDKTVKMSKTSNPPQCQGDLAMTVSGKMKEVSVKKAASMKLTKTGDYKGHK